MTKEQILARQAELRSKKTTLMAELDTADEKRFAEIQLETNKINLEVEELEKDLRSLNQQDEEYTPEFRFGQENNPANKKKVDEMTREELRSAGLSALGKMVRSTVTKGVYQPKFTAQEKRALGEATWSTSKNYTVASDGTDGTNNGGIFIPNTVLYDLLVIDTVENPFLKDCKPTFERGVLIYPYKELEVYSKGKSVKEKEETGAKSVKIGSLSLVEGNYALKVGITLELLEKADAELGQYILADLKNETDIITSEDIFYGDGKDYTESGADKHILGVCKDTKTIKANYADGEEIATITDYYLQLDKRARKGAKIYASPKFAMKLSLKTDESGQYLLPIYNGVGLKSIVQIPFEICEDLNDCDFIIGNAKNYKMNFHGTSPKMYDLGISTNRIQTFLIHLMVAGRPAPGYFVYGKMTGTTPKE